MGVYYTRGAILETVYIKIKMNIYIFLLVYGTKLSAVRMILNDFKNKRRRGVMIYI